MVAQEFHFDLSWSIKKKNNIKIYYVKESRRVWIEDYSEKLFFLQRDVMN